MYENTLKNKQKKHEKKLFKMRPSQVQWKKPGLWANVGMCEEERKRVHVLKATRCVFGVMKFKREGKGIYLLFITEDCFGAFISSSMEPVQTLLLSLTLNNQMHYSVSPHALSSLKY